MNILYEIIVTYKHNGMSSIKIVSDFCLDSYHLLSISKLSDFCLDYNHILSIANLSDFCLDSNHLLSIAKLSEFCLGYNHLLSLVMTFCVVSMYTYYEEVSFVSAISN